MNVACVHGSEASPIVNFPKSLIKIETLGNIGRPKLIFLIHMYKEI